jgi:hypothetical protein
LELANNNRGALFRNDDKKDDNDRDYSGSITINGQEFWLSGYVKQSNEGKKFLSLSAKPKDVPARAAATSRRNADMDDSIPF